MRNTVEWINEVMAIISKPDIDEYLLVDSEGRVWYFDSLGNKNDFDIIDRVLYPKTALPLHDMELVIGEKYDVATEEQLNAKYTKDALGNWAPHPYQKFDRPSRHAGRTIRCLGVRKLEIGTVVETNLGDIWESLLCVNG